MKTPMIALAVLVAAPCALAQTTIWKHVDENGKVTYTNRPMKGAVVVELDPLNTYAGSAPNRPSLPEKAPERVAAAKPAVATVTPAPRAIALPLPPQVAAVAIDPGTQKGRDDVRRRILEDELRQEEATLAKARDALRQEQQNPALIAAVRVAQQSAEPTPAQQAEMRAAIDKASGRIRGLQSTVAEHEKNVEALKKELGALKP